MKLIIRLIIVIQLVWSCSTPTGEIIPEEVLPLEKEISAELALKWANLTLEVIKNSPENSPTYASRSLAYMGLSMYESVVQGSIIYQSVSSSLNGLGEMPIAADSLSIDWELSLNAAQAVMLKGLYPHAPMPYTAKIDSLNQAVIQAKKEAMLSDKVLQNSASFGIAVANKILDWSSSDGGHRGFERTLDRNYPLKTGLQFWFPPRVGQSAFPLPMHPYWGENRNFILKNGNLPMPEMIPFSQDKESKYYKEMETVYLIQRNLDQKSKENALWWGDDPAVSVSPPGHSYYLTMVLVEQEKTQLFEAASAFAKVGLSVAESFINCWRCKYYFSSERPTPFIRRVIDRNFTQFWPEPPFPAFTSGHSSQAAAAATALISVFGNDTPFTDKLHEGRPKDELRNVEFKSRSFNTIWEMAEECGYSRLEGGIHTPQDNTIGLSEGKKVAENVIALPWQLAL